MAFAPGRVNLMGDHTDYVGGLVLPMGVQFGTTVALHPGGTRVRLESEGFDRPADIALDVADPASVEPDWARYVAGVVATIRPAAGGTGRVTTTIPVGAGLSSSAALEVAVALAFGFRGDHLELAAACQRAEQVATGVPCGIMDQLCSAAAQDGHALLIDCALGAVEPVRMPDEWQLVVVPSGQSRRLSGTGYAERRAQCEAAQMVLGPLRQAELRELAAIRDEVVRRRARHVITENGRVRAMAGALEQADITGAGRLMLESHASLRDDFEVSTPALDELVEGLVGRAGVHGARLTGAGFGGCVVALTDPGALDCGWAVKPSPGAWVRRPVA